MLLRVSLGSDVTFRSPRNVVTAVRVTTINESPFEVTIYRVFLYSFGDPGHMWFADTGEQGVPLTVPARQRAEFRFDTPDGYLFGDEPVIARIWTATGKEFLSPKGPLGSVQD